MFRMKQSYAPESKEACSACDRTCLHICNCAEKANQAPLPSGGVGGGRCWSGFLGAGSGFLGLYHWHCKVTKKSWNFQIVSTRNSTFGYENCTFGSFWCFLGECRSTKVFQAICNPMQTAILPPFLLQITDYSLFMSPSSRAMDSETIKICK